MNELKIETNKKLTAASVPDCFDEMDRYQFIDTAKQILGIISNDSYYLSMIDLDKDTWNELEDFHRYSIRQLFDFINTPSPEISRQLLPYIEIDGQQFIGYQPNFSNTTWEEFIFADQYIMNGKYKEAAAVLYRPQRENYNGETDRRSPFTIYGTDSRMQYFEKIDEPQLLAFAINYRALRKRNLEDKYALIFSSQKQTASSTATADTFSWISIHRNLMGDQFYDETKFFNTNVQVILNRLNTVIKENQHHKKS